MTVEQIENAFGGNLCRCTGNYEFFINSNRFSRYTKKFTLNVLGYRPILEAFKAFAKNYDSAKLVDLEVSCTILNNHHVILRKNKQKNCLYDVVRTPDENTSI